VTYGDQDAVRLDPIAVLAMIARSPGTWGSGATRSTTYYQPYHIARTFARLDHLTRGRVAWNVVTSVGLATLSSHANYDLAQHALDEPVGNVRVQGMQGRSTRWSG
jgi:alkanesulfonate monooxygenase SsuD/methylene tetrahydromethanopterin reductase-like flavin-dependent oxidoreductase (luciferase family)